MPFPVIRHIDDVLPAIQGRDEFVVGKRDGYTFIDYNYVDGDTFDCPIRRECRGLKFDMDGKLIARPFHKFFNLHEKPNEVPALTGDNHTIMEKLDGSMVHPAMVNGELVFMTRAGVTDQAKAALDACKRLPYGRALLDYCKHCIVVGKTPIFEYTSPSNQIVIRYAEEAVTLIGARWNASGQYSAAISMSVLRHAALFPVVRTFDPTYDLAEFVTYAKSLTDTEGFVIRCGDWMGKVKADAYCATHRAKSGLLWEKDVLRLVLEQKVDDVAGLLPPDEAAHLLDWAETLTERLKLAARIYRSIVGRSPDQLHTVNGVPQRNRKAFAEYIQDRFKAGGSPSVCFKIYDGADAYEALCQYALKQTSSTKKARDFLHHLGGVAEWKPVRTVGAEA